MIYEGPNGEIHVIEAKGGGSEFGSRITALDKVAQKGTIKYRDDIIGVLKKKLGDSYSLK